MKAGVIGYIVKDADGRPVLGQFAEATLLDWTAATAAAQSIPGAGLTPIVPPQPTADGPRRPGRPKRTEASE
jgi:hypothetical protein